MDRGLYRIAKHNLTGKTILIVPYEVPLDAHLYFCVYGYTLDELLRLLKPLLEFETFEGLLQMEGEPKPPPFFAAQNIQDGHCEIFQKPVYNIDVLDERWYVDDCDGVYTTLDEALQKCTSQTFLYRVLPELSTEEQQLLSRLTYLIGGDPTNLQPMADLLNKMGLIYLDKS